MKTDFFKMDNDRLEKLQPIAKFRRKSRFYLLLTSCFIYRNLCFLNYSLVGGFLYIIYERFNLFKCFVFQLSNSWNPYILTQQAKNTEDKYINQQQFEKIKISIVSVMFKWMEAIYVNDSVVLLNWLISNSFVCL